MEGDFSPSIFRITSDNIRQPGQSSHEAEGVLTQNISELLNIYSYIITLTNRPFKEMLIARLRKQIEDRINALSEARKTSLLERYSCHPQTGPFLKACLVNSINPSIKAWMEFKNSLTTPRSMATYAIGGLTLLVTSVDNLLEEGNNDQQKIWGGKKIVTDSFFAHYLR